MTVHCTYGKPEDEPMAGSAKEPKRQPDKRSRGTELTGARKSVDICS